MISKEVSRKQEKSHLLVVHQFHQLYHSFPNFYFFAFLKFSTWSILHVFCRLLFWWFHCKLLNLVNELSSSKNFFWVNLIEYDNNIYRLEGLQHSEFFSKTLQHDHIHYMNNITLLKLYSYYISLSYLL